MVVVAYILGVLPVAAVVALGGRVLLSWLPPGSLGSHRRGERASTVAVSWTLAAGTIGVTARWAQLAGHEDGTGLLAVAAAVALVARVSTLPAALVPRHAPPAERGGRATRLVLLAVVAAIVWKIAGDPRLGLLEDLRSRELDERRLEQAESLYQAWMVAVLSFAIGAIAVAHGLRVARRAPLERSLVVLAAALATPLIDAPRLDFVHARAAFVLGLACAIAWWRRADRRALAVAAILFGTCALSEQTIALTLAGMLALVAGTAAASRRKAVAWCLGTAVVFAAPVVLGPLGSLGPLRASAELGRVDLRGVTWTGIAALVALVAVLAGRVGRSSEARTPAGIDEPRRSARAIGIALVGGALGMWGTAELGWLELADQPSWALALVAVGPAAWLGLGLAVTRAERPIGRATP